MAKYSIEDTTLTNIANAIRTKGNTTDTLTPTQMPDAINAIQAGGGSGTWDKIYFNSATSGGGSATTQVIDLDVSNASTLTFKYDFLGSDTAGWVSPLTFTLYLGYNVQPSGRLYKYKAVDATTATKTVVSQLTALVENGTYTVDVSNYSTITFNCAFAKNSSYSSSNSSLCIYGIELSQEDRICIILKIKTMVQEPL